MQTHDCYVSFVECILPQRTIPQHFPETGERRIPRADPSCKSHSAVRSHHDVDVQSDTLSKEICSIATAVQGISFFYLRDRLL